MKKCILTLGLHPRPLEHIMITQRPKECYLVVSEDGLRYIAKEHGYTKPNSTVLRAAARKARCKLSIYKCDPFNPESIGDALGKILERVKMDDEVIINYSGGTQAMSLVLGSVAIVLSRIMPIRILYSTRPPKGKEKIYDHTQALKELFRRLYEFVPGAA